MDALNHWKHSAISKISLDITPSYQPDRELDVAERDRDLTLSQSPVRVWHDRDGNVLSEGRLTDIKWGRVMVLDENNQIVKMPVEDLSSDDLCFLAAWWGVPTECTLGDDPYIARNFQATTMTWKASGLCHKPLYFEEVQLERYGHTAGPVFQPVISGAHFFLNIFTLPYQAGINPPWECRYALGYYRPGSCAPWLIPPVPLSVRGRTLAGRRRWWAGSPCSPDRPCNSGAIGSTGRRDSKRFPPSCILQVAHGTGDRSVAGVGMESQPTVCAGLGWNPNLQAARGWDGTAPVPGMEPQSL